MTCTDMGGPVNKAAYAFGVGLLSTQTDGPMAATMAAGMVPPLAMGLATMLRVTNSTKRSRKVAKPLWYWDCASFRKVQFRLLLVIRCVCCRAVSWVGADWRNLNGDWRETDGTTRWSVCSADPGDYAGTGLP
ncbi:hypothetical protein ACVXHA_15785 [Escherichia coli]